MSMWLEIIVSANKIIARMHSMCIVGTVSI